MRVCRFPLSEPADVVDDEGSASVRLLAVVPLVVSAPVRAYVLQNCDYWVPLDVPIAVCYSSEFLKLKHRYINHEIRRVASGNVSASTGVSSELSIN